MRIDNRLYQIKTNNRYSKTQRSIALTTQRNDSMNLNANEINRRKYYNCEKKNHIMKRCQKSKSTQQFNILKKDVNEKDKKLS